MNIIRQTILFAFLSAHSIFAMDIVVKTDEGKVFTHQRPSIKISKKMDPVDAFILQHDITLKPYIEEEKRVALKNYCSTQFNFYLNVINGATNERIPLAQFCDVLGKIITQRYACRDWQEEAVKMLESLAETIIQEMKIWYERCKFFENYNTIETQWKEIPLPYDALILKKNSLQKRCYFWIKICQGLESTKNSYEKDYMQMFYPSLVSEPGLMPNATNNAEHRKQLSLMTCGTLIYCYDATEQITAPLMMLYKNDQSSLKRLEVLIKHYETMALDSLEGTKIGFNELNIAHQDVADRIIIEPKVLHVDTDSESPSSLPDINKSESRKKKRMSGLFTSTTK